MNNESQLMSPAIERYQSWVGSSIPTSPDEKNSNQNSLQTLPENLRQTLPQELSSENETIWQESLRLNRHLFWIKAAKDSLAGLNPRLICETWSDRAEEILLSAFHACFSDEFALIVVGKLGSRELNISSDIDLQIVCASDEKPYQSSLQRFQRLLSIPTARGWCFRIDFDLRPGGRMASVVPTVDQYCDYYGNYGETWERMAMIRARVIAGKPDLIRTLQDFHQRFIYRRYLDFHLMDDLKSLRRKIHDFHPIENKKIDLKYVPGGIRDIELFVHALQVLNGGRNPKLRLRSTEDALNELMNASLLNLNEGKFLIQLYWDLRLLENYVQSINDEHTHVLVVDDPHPDFVANLIPQLADRLNRCEKFVTELLGERGLSESHSSQNLSPLVGQTSDEQNRIHELIEELRSIPILSRQKERDTGERDLFLTQFMNTLSEHQGNTVRSMQFLVDFVRSTKAKNNFFILLNRTPELLETFTWIFSRSPFMAQVLISRPELLDAFILRSQEDTSEESPDFLDALFERKLLHSLIAGSEFLRNLQVHPLTQHLTEMANEVAQKILHRLNDTYGARVGLVALGKWGGQELGFSSDLDFVFVTAHSETQDDSATEMAENNYKVAKRFVSWITELRKGGRFYNIDLRLRPLGSAGPLLMSWPELLSFLATQAPPWQRLSYLKARLVVAPNSDRLSTSHARQEILEAISQNPLSPEDITELHEIRRKLLVSDSWDIKKSPGGLIDIELSVQIALLSRGIQPKGTSIMSHFQDISQALHNVPAHESIALLMENYDKLRQIEQLMHLLSETNDHHPKPGTPLFTEIAQIFQRNPLDLERDFLSLFSANEKALMELQSDAEST